MLLLLIIAIYTSIVITWKWSAYSYTIHESWLLIRACMLLIIQKQRAHYYLCPLVLWWDQFQVKAVVYIRRWQWLMKLTGVCGHSCLMYRCSPHRISWMPCGEYWVFHHKFTQLFTQRVSVVSQQAHFNVVRCGPTCLSPLAVDFQGPAVLIPWCFWLKSFSQFLEVIITTREVEKVLRSSAEYFLFFDKRAIPLTRAVLGRQRRH